MDAVSQHDFGLRSFAGQAADRRQEQVVDLLIVAVHDPAGGDRQQYGLLVSQVHSIVRLNETTTVVRPSDAGAAGELAYEGGWIPIRHLGQLLGRERPTAPGEPAHGGAVRILGIKTLAGGGTPAAGAARPPYLGVIVDEVVEIVSYPVRRILPFPRWVITSLPSTAVWGAIPSTAVGLSSEPANGAPLAGRPPSPPLPAAHKEPLLLLLDAIALAGQAEEP